MTVDVVRNLLFIIFPEYNSQQFSCCTGCVLWWESRQPSKADRQATQSWRRESVLHINYRTDNIASAVSVLTTLFSVSHNTNKQQATNCNLMYIEPEGMLNYITDNYPTDTSWCTGVNAVNSSQSHMWSRITSWIGFSVFFFSCFSQIFFQIDKTCPATRRMTCWLLLS